MSGIPENMLSARKKVSDRYIAGNGIEIGALHHPLQVGAEARIKYVDRLPVDQLRLQYPELANYDLVHVDIIDDGEKLSTVPNESLDFIIANHMLEHCENPLGTIRNHLSKVKPGGILYYAIPEKTQCFDAARALTTFAHLTQDDKQGPEGSRYEHFSEWVRIVNKINDDTLAQQRIDQLLKINYSIHFHVWDEKSFGTFIQEARDYLGNLFDIEYFHRNDTEVITVLKKIRNA